jgi:putative DNA primase/helicase
MPDDAIARLADFKRETAAQPDRADSGSPATSDDALALKFTARHRDGLCYVAGWGRWLQWDGSRWRFEDTLAAFDMARAIARSAAQICNKPSEASKIASAKTVAAIERLARADRAHARGVEIWDTDPGLLNTPGGIIDLISGNRFPHDPKRYVTKITAVAPEGACPQWLTFIARITEGNDGLPEFLQRIAGYSLTGITREHALFFFHGTGGNGKGVFLNTLTAIFGDYASVAPMETFMASHNERHPTDLAGLRGARFVTAQEVEDGQRWAESKIKALTGGDPISARFMRQDFFTFTPQFKLAIAGNHKPSLRTVDEAIRRRFHLIPFTVSIPDHERDEQLPEKLKDEWPGILQWAINGCLEWQRIGLAPPACVTTATEAYLEAEDSVNQWLAEHCTTGDPARYKADNAELFTSWQKWCERSGEIPGHRKALFDKLDHRGFNRIRGHAGKRGFSGLSVNQEDASGEWWNR